MKKNDVFTFTAPNGVEVTAVVVHVYETRNEWYSVIQSDYLCYAQNRIFTYFEEVGRRNAFTPDEETYILRACYGKVLVDYAVLPDYDAMLEDYYHQIDMANDYADKTL